jgi:EF hand
MRTLLCMSVVLVFTTTAHAQFGGKDGLPRTTARNADATQRKTADKAHSDHAAKATEQAGTETDLANALLAVMDTDGDGIVTSIEYSKALKAINKIKKDSKGNRAYDKPADANNTAAAAGDAGQAGAGALGPGGARGNEMMARFMQYDTNHNGVLEPNEVPPQARAMLQGADLNGDGVIDANEWQAFAARMGDRMKAVAAGADANGGAGAAGNGGRKPPRN